MQIEIEQATIIFELKITEKKAVQLIYSIFYLSSDPWTKCIIPK